MKAKTIDTEAYQRFAIEKLGFAFHDVNLLVTALTHRSYINEHQDEAAEHNERLEFLGDAVLELVTSDYLFRNFHQKEGTGGRRWCVPNPLGRLAWSWATHP